MRQRCRSSAWGIVLGLIVLVVGVGLWSPGGASRAASPPEASSDPWRGPVEGVTWTRPEAVIEGERNESPDLAVDGLGNVWMAWVGFPDGQESIHVVRRTPGPDGRVIPVIRLGAGQGPTGWPRVAAYGRYVWVTWAEQRDGQFQIRLAHFHQEKFLKVETVSTGTGDAIRPVIALDASQTPWVAWEERRKRHFTVLVRRMSRFLKSHPWVVDETGELNLRPALVGGPGKSVTIAWDHYENGAYDIRLRRVLERKMEPPVWITRDDYLDQAPALQIDAVGRTWIAWHSNRPSEGAASQAPRAGRSLQIAALEQGSLRPPAAGQPPTLPAMPGRLELDERLEFPTLAQDRAGRLFLFARRGQGFVALHLSGDGWSAPIDLSDPGWGGRGRDLRVSLGPDGTFHTVARWLHRVGYGQLKPPKEPASTIRLAPPSATRPLLGDHLVKPATRGSSPQIGAGYLSDRLAPGSGFRLPEHRLFFGDLHTHSWVSDGTGDPDEIFTRARDLLGHDFVALTDHDVSNGNRLAPFEWAWEQMLTDFFNDPGQFATLVAYEWTSPSVERGGAGHRNVYFPGERAPLFGVDLEAPDTRTLFELLRPLGAITIPHHISWTGTDWENFDPDLQPLLEIISVHGNSEVAGGGPIAARVGNAASYAADGLKLGHQFGFVGGSDGHGMPWHYGVSRQEDVWTTGLTGVYAPILERLALLENLRRRRCFATSGGPLRVWIDAGGKAMGEVLEVAAESPATVEVALQVRGNGPLASVALVREGEVVETFPLRPNQSALETLTRITPEPERRAYYLRVIQQDGAMAWSSPVWVLRR